MQDWAEIRRLHRAEGVSISEIARRLGIARNTVRAALASDRPPNYVRLPRGSKVDAFEPQIRALLAEFRRMSATVIAERIGWKHQLQPLWNGKHPAGPATGPALPGETAAGCGGGTGVVSGVLPEEVSALPPARMRPAAAIPAQESRS